MRRLLRWGRDAGAEALRRMGANVWMVLQTTVAATVAWAIALRLAGHPQPFFAPISAVVTLTAARGERGTNAVRLLLGVLVGILAGEIVSGVLGESPWTLPLSVFLAMMTAVALRAVRLMMVQSAASAILTVVFAGGAGGAHRLVDALIGAGVAVLTVQLLFPPDPVRLLREAVMAALADMAAGLGLVERALESGDKEDIRRATDRLREENEQLNELTLARNFSHRIAQRVPLRRGLIDRVNARSKDARVLYLLNISCLMLTRAAFSLPEPERAGFVPVVRGLAEALDVLAGGPDDQTARQSSADRAFEAVRPLRGGPPAPEPYLATAAMAARMVAVDLMLFTGVDPEQALTCVREGRGEPAVPPPPPK